MARTPKAGHWYQWSASHRLTGDGLGMMLALHCPDCGGYLDRAAYRDGADIGRRWTAFGYRCSKCNALFVEAGK